MRLTSIALVSSLLLGAGAAQASVLDQSSAPGNVGLNDTGFAWQQRITQGIVGQLVGIVLYSHDGDDVATVSVSTSEPGPAISFIYTTGSETLTAAGTYFDLTGANFFLSAGSPFTIEVSGGTLGCCHVSGTETSYAGGDLFLNGSTDYSTQYGYWLSFETFVDPPPPPPVPEPATLLVFSAALAGAGWARKRRQAR